MKGYLARWAWYSWLAAALRVTGRVPDCFWKAIWKTSDKMYSAKANAQASCAAVGVLAMKSWSPPRFAAGRTSRGEGNTVNLKSVKVDRFGKFHGPLAITATC